MRQRYLSTTIRLLINSNVKLHKTIPTQVSPFSVSLSRRTLSTGREGIDERIEEIAELYATAKDEFEIATEETDKKTVYAQDDRTAAREELDKLCAVYQNAIKADGGDEIQRRIGQRIRELDHAVKALEERALHE